MENHDLDIFNSLLHFRSEKVSVDGIQMMDMSRQME
jgi:hypothetical protein